MDEPEPVRVQTLPMFMEVVEPGHGFTELLGTDPNPFVKGKILPGYMEEHDITFLDGLPSPEKQWVQILVRRRETCWNG